MTRLARYAAPMVAALALIAATTTGTADATPAPTPPTDRASWTRLMATLPPCAEEDSRDCAWDAGESGNGIGTSFLDLDGTAYYADGSTQTN